MRRLRARNDTLLTQPEGGSLNELHFQPDTVVKSYSGDIPRGYDKLFREYCFLKSLPPHVARWFARPVLFVDRADPRLTELHLRRQPEPAVAKAILRGLLRPAQTRRIVEASLRVLLYDLYPIRRRNVSGPEVYARFHAPRLKSALTGLRRFPAIRDVIDASDLRINGAQCPSTAATVAWIDQHARWHFPAARLVAAHGDAHLDNILAATDGPPSITFVDPRGELTMPPHYDFAKMAKALRTGYDLVHYGEYELQVATSGTTLRVDLAVDHAYDEHYRTALEVLVAAVPDYAAAERVSPAEFRRVAAIAELVHIISFSYYHANHPRGCDPARVVAYLATAALLAGDLMRRPFDSDPVLAEPLPL